MIIQVIRVQVLQNMKTFLNNLKLLCDRFLAIFSIDNFITLGNYVSVFAFLSYLYAMVIYPFSNGDWAEVQKLWLSWQSLNVGMLAFGSSIIAFNISRYNAEKQRQRNFVAARAFLPHSLSELCKYLKDSTVPLKEAYNTSKLKGARKRKNLDVAIPELPKSYEKVFQSCISNAKPEVGNYLSKIVMLLQIHQARLLSLSETFNPKTKELAIPQNYVADLCSTAEIRALINNLFEFARSEEPFKDKPLDWEDYKTAYNNLKIQLDDIDDLQGFTERTL